MTDTARRPTNSSVPPVSDWATDFDHADPAYNANAHQIWHELRETCPVAHTERYAGAWLPVRGGRFESTAPSEEK